LFTWRGFWHGVKNLPRAVAEPALVAGDIVSAGMIGVHNAFVDESNKIYSEDTVFKSGTANRMLQNINAGGSNWQNFRAGAVLATAMPSGGGLVLLDTSIRVFEEDMTAEEADFALSSFLGTQTTATGVGMVISKATGHGWTGRSSPSVKNETVSVREQSHSVEQTTRGNISRVNLTGDENIAVNVPARAGYFDVIAHGSAKSIDVVGATGKFHGAVSASVLARYLTRYTQYGGQSIRLLSCSTGKTTPGFASQLSSIMNVEVLAPNSTLWVFPDGYFLVTGKDINPITGQRTPVLPPEGEFILFTGK
jgi:hypothetical protein